MITIFTIPKPFIGHINIIQRNAIRSWIYLHPKCEIVLCGNDSGTEEVAKEFHIKCIPDILRNEFGTPLLSSAFEEVKKAASNEIMCYVNSDIIFLSDFISSIKRINIDKFLIIGNRWNMDINEEIDFDDSNWEEEIKKCVNIRGSLQPPLGSDYFVFNKNESLSSIPEFSVGRPGWDNWFIYNARLKKYKIIDASNAIIAIHQNHDYNHMNKYHTNTGKSKLQWGGWEGPEVYKNKELMNDMKILFKLIDATHILTKSKLMIARDYEHINRLFHTIPIFCPKLWPFYKFIDNNIISILRRYKNKRPSS